VKKYSIIEGLVNREILQAVDGGLRREVAALFEEHKALKVAYQERGDSMRETGDMVRSLYEPKIHKALIQLNDLVGFRPALDPRVVVKLQEIKKTLKKIGDQK
jgi:hypothetical protein